MSSRRMWCFWQNAWSKVRSSAGEGGFDRCNMAEAYLPAAGLQAGNRGFRWWNKGGGSRTSNSHFTRDDGTRAYVGYVVDSLTVGLVAVCRVKFADL